MRKIKPIDIKLFNDKLTIYVSDEDWEFMCNNRFFTDTPETDAIEAEFITGTGILSTDADKWDFASERFAEYVADLKDIMGLNI